MGVVTSLHQMPSLPPNQQRQSTEGKVDFNKNKNNTHWPNYITYALFTFRHRLDSGRYCILACHAKDEIIAAHHSQKVEQPWCILRSVYLSEVYSTLYTIQ